MIFNMILCSSTQHQLVVALLLPRLYIKLSEAFKVTGINEFKVEILRVKIYFPWGGEGSEGRR